MELSPLTPFLKYKWEILYHVCMSVKLSNREGKADAGEEGTIAGMFLNR